jgi:4-alpha-glucanotransferase
VVSSKLCVQLARYGGLLRLRRFMGYAKLFWMTDIERFMCSYVIVYDEEELSLN